MRRKLSKKAQLIHKGKKPIKRSTPSPTSNQNNSTYQPSLSREDNPNCPCCIDYWIWGADKITTDDCSNDLVPKS